MRIRYWLLLTVSLASVNVFSFLFDEIKFEKTLLFSPRLTWRDLQHIVVLTSRQANLEADDWVLNGVGRPGDMIVTIGLLGFQDLSVEVLTLSFVSNLDTKCSDKIVFVDL